VQARCRELALSPNPKGIPLLDIQIPESDQLDFEDSLKCQRTVLLERGVFERRVKEFVSRSD